ncbi:unnamed protein product [Effrenium voratum]|uniref:Uncharacterized protein n=1 Tax=Effrenium voratum TaxID=2562239 RepID=A0AA36IA09_9DINO|nr:unnamed protein product [Effrenium voratum]CAJ1443011.1 unnamed protein product [Effrenium voratum]
MAGVKSAPGKTGTRAALVPMQRAVLLTKEDLENFQNNAFNRDSVSSLLPFSSRAAPVVSAPSSAAGPVGGWPPAPRRRTRSASARQPSSEVALPCADVVPVSQVVLNPGCREAALAAAKSLVNQGIKKPSRVVRSKTLSRMDRISPEPAPSGRGDSPLVLQGYAPSRRDHDRTSEGSPSVAECSPESAASAALQLGWRDFLQVSGHAPANPCAVESPPWEEEDWTSSERETEAESDTEAFYYRQYRYREVMSQRAPAPDVRPKKLRRGATRGPSGPNLEEEEMVSAWPMGWEPGPWPVSSGRGLLQTQWDAEPDERREVDLLQRVAEALSQFYGLGEGGVRLPSDVVNVVVVTEEAWKHKQRESQLEEPPVLWVRGGRVYDFHGDRGTVAEFENDLLSRQVEDDAICRQRRQKQGLLPFPFLALPQKEKEELDEEKDAKDVRDRRR